MILDAYGRPVRSDEDREKREALAWLERDTYEILAGRFGHVAAAVREERIEALRASVAEERSTPAAEDKQVGIAIRFVRAFTLETAK